MFGKIKNFAVKKLLETQLKGVPNDQREMLLLMIEKDPALFEKLAKELQEEMKKNGNNQIQAAMKILPKYQKEIFAVMTPEMKQKLINAKVGIQGKFNPNGSIRR